ncbi:Gfo/Idh/MocA family protein [Clostridium perfringens]|uniref:Oxidoreductase family protein n=1 Tax=Clostridium perfringens (strain SM101 / Type A) TaxID=289380 RepID=Q0STH8_CLOPS|nr:Gfo/Idh/MocA family oxidoreductase [Clostridium perfringens]ABG87511.1 oxidoreductase family protein [Clostridium perfringens SM101]EJT5924610.1 Gfo/Idh/MocA family oxidoreductase [Clostridium perfringens]EJT5938870.1 Gfo/Idh/MocA family oxidoreductase [Clostridium perfringens]EJT6471646.1 Gfo/Idh/MocA family oxidoreductase [Clostridium perfringens]MBP2861222.1 Gfo/Idh/MocA family oxidoreductase [Clostridium perfringens]
MKKLKWGILGPGNIARDFAQALNRVNGEVYAVASRNKERAEKFARENNVKKAYGSYDEIIKDKDIDVVYIATPHSNHYEYIIKSLNNNKHVLCEKAITVNERELEEALKIAREKNLVLEEAMTLFHMPLYEKVIKKINKEDLGKVNMVQVSFGSFKEYDENNRFFNLDLAGGALLDIGTYALSFARYFLSSMPDEILSTVKKAKTGVDEKSGIILKTKEDEIATISLAFRSKMPKRGIVSCDNGFITIDNFPRANKATINYLDGKVEVIECGEEEKALDYEVIFMEERIKENKESNSLELTYDVTKIMNKVRKDWGIFYPFENN